jgi:hypothetical protein
LKKGSQITATIKGGNLLAEYETEWFYKKENMSSFMPLNENCGFIYEEKKRVSIKARDLRRGRVNTMKIILLMRQKD